MVRAYAPWKALTGAPPLPMQDDYAARCAAGQAFVLIADRALAGLIVLEDFPDHLWIDNVAVDPARAGKGLGRTLMGFAEAEARRRFLPELRLLTNALMARNIALYARLGFTETARRVEKGRARVYMARALSG
ncbi:GNAT family N-acetyltransferase [Falsiroseomonas selenitidurans]|uniref:GNAT family N-acetyltransferase n=1 Tax=Falsiroseomonas selenitidurans TaxID=2716335 RepID=UPI002E2DB3BD|nr:GNAT family N-acetyltransferase [Falsiroseomonas selenitidurans]